MSRNTASLFRRLGVSVELGQGQGYYVKLGQGRSDYLRGPLELVRISTQQMVARAKDNRQIRPPALCTPVFVCVVCVVNVWGA